MSDVINNFTLQELRAVFAAEAKQTGNEEKSISIAGAPGISNIETSYNITEIVKFVQFNIPVICSRETSRFLMGERAASSKIILDRQKQQIMKILIRNSIFNTPPPTPPILYVPVCFVGTKTLHTRHFVSTIRYMFIKKKTHTHTHKKPKKEIQTKQQTNLESQKELK